MTDLTPELDNLEKAQARLLSVAGELLGITEPNEPIDGLDLSVVRNLASEVATKIVIEDDVEALLIEIISRLPDVHINYDNSGREALVIKSRLADFQQGVLGYYRAVVASNGIVSAPVDKDVMAQLETIRGELVQARTDLSSLKTGLEQKSGLSLQLGVISVEVDSVIRLIGGVLPGLSSGRTNLGALKTNLDTIRDRILAILHALEGAVASAGRELLALARQAAVSASRAVMAGLEAFQRFLAAQVDRTKVPPEKSVLDEVERPIQSRVVIKNHDDITSWLKLNSALERLAARNSLEISRDTSDAGSLLGAGLIDQGIYNRIVVARDGLRKSMQDQRSMASEYALATLRLVDELDHLSPR